MASQFVDNSESIAAFIPDLERLIAEAMDEWKIPGLAVAMVQNGEVALLKAYGLRDVEAGLTAKTDTQFLIGSVTTSFIATVSVISTPTPVRSRPKPCSRSTSEGSASSAAERLNHT